MKIDLVKHILYYLKGTIFFPHLLLLITSNSKQLVMFDAKKTIKPLGIKYSGTMAVLWLLENDRYFRTMFYQRLGILSNLVSWYAPGERTFIPCCPVIGGGIYLAHPYATILNAKSIGRNFTVRQCTTIGNKKDGRNDLTPVIGDNVNVGANVVIIGNITIGNNVIIGAGSVVVHDVQDNSVVAGNPARVIKTLK